MTLKIKAYYINFMVNMWIFRTGKYEWVVLDETQEYNGTNSDVLESLQINEDTPIYLIKKINQPEKKLIYQ